jgi:hypothetical protein
MNHRQEAEVFSGAIDARFPGEPSGQIPTAIGIARMIHRADFSRASAALPALEATLARVPSRGLSPRPWRRRDAPARAARALLRPAPSAAILLALALIIVQCVMPGGIPALGKAVETAVLSFLQVGPHTRVKVIDPADARRGTGAAAPWWRVATPSGVVMEQVPAGAPVEGWSFDGYDGALALIARAAPRAPSVVPDGYALRRVVVSPSKEWLVASYGTGSGGEIAVIAHRAAHDGGTEYNTDSRSGITRAQVNGAAAAWASGALAWEADGTSYIIASGGALSLEQTIRMAESMR